MISITSNLLLLKYIDQTDKEILYGLVVNQFGLPRGNEALLHYRQPFTNKLNDLTTEVQNILHFKAKNCFNCLQLIQESI